MTTQPDLPALDLLTCCTTAYSHPAARWLLGDSFHPGGLKLTTQLAKLLEIDSASRVLDIGCGRGASAVHLARTTGCTVVGLTPEEDGIAAGKASARAASVDGRTTFLQGTLDANVVDGDGYDVAVMECVFSIMPDKTQALSVVRGLLRDGGRVGLTDVTVHGPIPDDLKGVLGTVGCVGDAMSLDAYREAVAASGFEIEHVQDLRDTAASFLRDLKGKLLIAEIAVRLGKLPVSVDMLQKAKGYLARAQSLVKQGTLSYGLVTARKSA